MSAQHPSRTYKGCALCKPHKRRGIGKPDRAPVSVLRQLGGRRSARRAPSREE